MRRADVPSGTQGRVRPLQVRTMNVVIVNRVSHEVIARYEIHRAGDGPVPPDEIYFDEAWRKAVADRLVEADHRGNYDFQLQRPKTLYEASR